MHEIYPEHYYQGLLNHPWTDQPKAPGWAPVFNNDMRIQDHLQSDQVSAWQVSNTDYLCASGTTVIQLDCITLELETHMRIKLSTLQPL